MLRLLLTTAAVAATVPAVAGTLPAGYEPVRIAVDYRLSDAATPTGRAALAARVKAAIGRACPAADIRDLHGLRAMAKCRADARAATGDQLAALDARLARRGVQTAAR